MNFKMSDSGGSMKRIILCLVILSAVSLSYAGDSGDVPALKDVFKDNFDIGTCVELKQLEGEEGEMVKRHFTTLTAENIMKPQYLAPSEDKFFFDDADKLVDFAVKNNKRLRGHTLVWEQQCAKWMFVDSAGKKVSKEVLLKRLEKYIKTVVGRYKGKVYAWDVVNEPLDMGDFKFSDWYEIAGEEFIEKAFIWAHEADPNAKLFLNEMDTTEKHKEKALYDLVKSLKDKNIPIHGIGMQYHVTVDYPGIQAVSDSLKKFSDLGLEIHITELDMSINADPALVADNATDYQLFLQAFRYKELFRVFKENKSVTNVTFWGFHDGHTWLTYFPVKKVDWPLLFDKSLKPKYAYWGIVDPSKLPKDVKGIEKKNLIAKAVRGTPKLDGVEDKVWKKASTINVNVFVLGKGSTGSAKALWDDKNLYVFFKVKDNKLSNNSSNAYEQDSVEVFVDEKNNKSFEYMEDDAQYRVSYENLVTLNGYPSKIKSKAKKVKGGYVVEMMIPFSTIKPAAGIQIGFDLQINDDPGTGKRGAIAKWNDPTNESYRNTSGFGTLVLE